MKNKILTLTLAAAFVLTAFTGCSDAGSEYPADNFGNASGNYYNGGNIQNETNDCEEYSYYEPDQSYSTEEYAKIPENGFKSVAAAPLSTFSADVDTASYSNVRRMINDYGYVTDKDAVRLEEMINYFNYDYAPPKDDVPFSVTTELSGCPWNEKNKLLSIGIKGKEIQDEERIPSNIVFLLDVSGSMNSPDKLPLMINAFSMLAENLTEDDRVSIVTYAGSDNILLEGTAGNDCESIISALSSLTAGGSTYGSAGINTAYELAEKFFIENGNNRVILATDGDLNVGLTSEDELKKLISSKRDSGIYLSVLGFGTGNIKDNKMETLADNGNGNYSYIDSISEAQKTLVEEMGGTLYTIAKDVKFQVEFNPALVSEYRLVGYENRLMNDEDFYDDKKDAGEIGSGHTVTVLYEITPVSADIPLKYQQSEIKDNSENEYSDELLTVSIKYKEPDGEESKLLKYPVSNSQFTDFPSENMRFASCVAQFGMLLKESEYTADITYHDIEAELSSLDCIHEDKYKTEFAELVTKVSAH